MNLKKKIAVLMAATLLCGALAGCRKDSDETPENFTPETASPIADGLQTDYTDDADKTAYINAFRDTFDGMAETVAFETAETDDGSGIILTGYTGTAAEVRVPTQIGGKNVVEIDAGAFEGKSMITSLYIPDSVATLGQGLLADLTELRALRTPLMGESADSAQFLGALFGATKYEDNAVAVPATLAYLELGGAMESLADFALFECNDLICLTLPDSMKTLGRFSLYYCTSLLSVNVDRLTSVAEHAFDTCAALTRLEFGEGLTSIGIGALENCVALRSLTLPFIGGSQTENTYLGYLFGASVYDFSKGYYPAYLNKITLLEECTSIGDYAFYECETLKTVEMLGEVTSIGIRAFSGCIRLFEITLPDSLTTIRENAFYGCLSLEKLKFSETSALNSLGINAFYSCDGLREIKLPASLASLPASCFADCVSLETVDLGGVTQVGKNAFRNCARLANATASGAITFEDGNACAEKLFESKK